MEAHAKKSSQNAISYTEIVSNLTIVSTSADSTLHAISTFPFDDDENTMDYFTVAADTPGQEQSSSCNCTSSDGAQFISSLAATDWASTITLPSVRTSEVFSLAFESCKKAQSDNGTRMSAWQPLLSRTKDGQMSAGHEEWTYPILKNSTVIRHKSSKSGPFFARVVPRRHNEPRVKYENMIDGYTPQSYLSLVDAVRFGPCRPNVMNISTWVPDVVEYKHNINMDLLTIRCNNCTSDHSENVHQTSTNNTEMNEVVMERTFHLHCHRHKMTTNQPMIAPFQTTHQIKTIRTGGIIHTSATRRNFRSVTWNIDLDTDLEVKDKFGTPVSVGWYSPPRVEFTSDNLHTIVGRMRYSLAVEFKYEDKLQVVGPRIVSVPANHITNKSMHQYYTMVRERRDMDKWYNLSTVHLIPRHADTNMSDAMVIPDVRDCHRLQLYSIRPDMRKVEYTDGIPFSEHYRNTSHAIAKHATSTDCVSAITRAIVNGLNAHQTISECPEFRHAFCVDNVCRYIFDFGTQDVIVTEQTKDDDNVPSRVDTDAFNKCVQNNEQTEPRFDQDYSFKLRAQRCDVEPNSIAAQETTCRYPNYAAYHTAKTDTDKTKSNDESESPMCSTTPADFIHVAVTVNQKIPSRSIAPHSLTPNHDDAAIGLFLRSPLVPYFHGGLLGEQSRCNDTSGVLWPADLSPLNPDQNSSWGHEIKSTTGNPGVDLLSEVAMFRLMQACAQNNYTGLLSDTDYQECQENGIHQFNNSHLLFDPSSMCKWHSPPTHTTRVDFTVMTVRDRFQSWKLPGRATFIDPETISFQITLPAVGTHTEQVFKISKRTVLGTDANQNCSPFHQHANHAHGTYTRILSTFLPIQPVLMQRGRDVNNQDYLNCSDPEPTHSVTCATLNAMSTLYAVNRITAGPNGQTLPFAHNKKLYGVDGLGFNLMDLLEYLYIRSMRGTANDPVVTTNGRCDTFSESDRQLIPASMIARKVVLLRHLTELANTGSYLTINVAFKTLLMYESSDIDGTTTRRLLTIDMTDQNQTHDEKTTMTTTTVNASDFAQRFEELTTNMFAMSKSGTFPLMPIYAMASGLAITTFMSVL